jgi:hypothetical protein
VVADVRQELDVVTENDRFCWDIQNTLALNCLRSTSDVLFHFTLQDCYRTFREHACSVMDVLEELGEELERLCLAAQVS